MFILKDLVVDMTNFYSQYKLIEPYLKRKTPKVVNPFGFFSHFLETPSLTVFSYFFFVEISSQLPIKSILNLLKKEQFSMVSMSVCFVLLAQHLVLLTGGTRTDILDQQFSSR